VRGPLGYGLRMRAEPTRSHVDRLERIAAVLPLIADDDEIGAPESDESLDALEAALGRSLPPEVRAAYGVLGGGTSLAGGSLVLEAFFAGEAPVATHTDDLREWEWKIPIDVVVFGGDGGGQVFGLWLPTSATRRHPVLRLECGDDDGPDMGIVAQDLPAFLAAEIASVPWEDDVADVVRRTLGLPEPLVEALGRGIDEDVASPDAERQTIDPVLRWASPEVPEVAYDIYASRTTAEDVARIADRP